MSADEAFFDSNVLIYLTDEASGKSERTEDLLADGGVISVQVLNEFANVARRKVQLSWVETREFLDTFRATLEIVPLTLETHERALDLAEQYELSVYDGMIMAAAQLAGCRVLYSEDMHDGLVIDKVTIRNPYAGDPGGEGRAGSSASTSSHRPIQARTLGRGDRSKPPSCASRV